MKAIVSTGPRTSGIRELPMPGAPGVINSFKDVYVE